MATTFDNFGIVDPAIGDASAVWTAYHTSNWTILDALLTYIVCVSDPPKDEGLIGGVVVHGGEIVWFTGSQ